MTAMSYPKRPNSNSISRRKRQLESTLRGSSLRGRNISQIDYELKNWVAWAIVGRRCSRVTKVLFSNQTNKYSKKIYAYENIIRTQHLLTFQANIAQLVQCDALQWRGITKMWYKWLVKLFMNAANSRVRLHCEECNTVAGSGGPAHRPPLMPPLLRI